MTNRFYASIPLRVGDDATLDPERSHYVCRVLRHGTGDLIHCFNGDGGEYACEVTVANPKACRIRIVRETRRASPPSPRLHIGLALIKGQPMDRALNQATELGASDIWLLQTVRSNVRLDDERVANKLDHWRKVVASSAEQCGAVFVPKLNPPATLDSVIDAAAIDTMAFHPAASPMPNTLDPCDRLLLIGPEGGWDEQELEFFRQRDITCYALGSRTFRAETAPSVVLALVQQAQGWSSSE